MTTIEATVEATNPAVGAPTRGPGNDPFRGALDLRPSVSLDVLHREAALLDRVDRKYLVPLTVLPTLLHRLPASAEVLRVDGRDRFGYDTVYFDTPDLRSFRTAARRRPVRWKVRTRTYTDSDASWIEVKLRDRRGRTVKHRQPRTAGEPTSLTEADRAFVRGFEDGRSLDEAALAALVPTLRTGYRRVTLHEPVSASRATVDLGLRGSLVEVDGPGRAVDLCGYAVVETKTAGRPGPVDRVLWDLGYRPVRFSKYGTSMVALRPELPSNRWRRALGLGALAAEVPDEP